MYEKYIFINEFVWPFHNKKNIIYLNKSKNLMGNIYATDVCNFIEIISQWLWRILI